jgi:SAM-dependent methyltransferase
LDLHKIPAERYALIRVSDARPVLPIADASIDYVYCEGVLHHTSHPETILREFWRVLKPGGRACIMVYNRNSVWLHLYTAYDRMILKGDFRDMSLDQAFARNTDGEACPISRCYSPEEWKAICAGAGFDVEYVGGYLSLHELDLLGRLGKRAIGDPRLEDVHRSFLASLEYDDHGYPMSAGKHAGIGGVYRLLKRRPNEAPSAAAR